MAKKFVVWFKDVDKDDISIVGGKGANLGEMTKAGFPVPNGFIVTAAAYFHFLDEANIRSKIRDILHNLDVSDSRALDKAAASVQHLIIHSKFPKDIAQDVIAAYFQLSQGMLDHTLVAIRSSATAEDLPTASFAGQQSTFLNVRGEANVIEKVKEAWASLFTPRAIFYRATNHFDHFKVGIAVPIQKMVASEQSGIMFTIDPVTNDKGKVVIEAIYGLGEMIVQGSVTPDHYEVNKTTNEITMKTIHKQEKIMKKSGNKNVVSRVPESLASKVKLTNDSIISLAQLGKRIEKHYYFPQDIEWAIENGTIYIVQTRPVTTTGNANQELQSIASSQKKLIIATGDAASPGIASGPVKILKSAREIHKIVSGDILVAEMTNPDYVPAMRKAVAILTALGGRTSHAAIVSRELGIPAIVGARDILKKVKDGMMITINGATGNVYKGALSHDSTKSLPDYQHEIHNNIKTATKVYVNLAEPDRAMAVSNMNNDGVGLLRAEFMMSSIGIHPKKILHDKKVSWYVQTLAEQIGQICESFSPRPVVYRTSDFRTNEFHNLKGGALYEPNEPNPMLGFRGAARYIADAKVFEMELHAIKMVRNKMNHKNLWIMIPFVRTPKELLEVKKIMASVGLMRSPTFKIWQMVEIPSNVIRLDDFLDIGIDGVSIGSNDLTMLILGTDRDNSEVAHDFSELDPSVLWALERVVRTCSKRNVTVSICGQAPSDYPELVEKLVSWGITSLSVNADVLDSVRHTVYEAEEKIVKNRSKS